jgi:hypothetical protein
MGLAAWHASCMRTSQAGICGSNGYRIGRRSVLDAIEVKNMSNEPRICVLCGTSPSRSGRASCNSKSPSRYCWSQRRRPAVRPTSTVMIGPDVASWTSDGALTCRPEAARIGG